MAVFLATVTVTVARPSGAVDTHGWVLGDDLTEVGSWPGNVQERQPLSDPLASEGGGSGPFQPAVTRVADVYLDPDADVQAGDVLTAGGLTWVVASARPVPGPLPPLGAVIACECVLEG